MKAPTLPSFLCLSLCLFACLKRQDPRGVAPPTAVLQPGQGADAEALTYYKDIKPLMDMKCVSCHTADGLAGLDLTTYAKVKAVKANILLDVSTRQMPPWLAEEGHQSYRDDLSLSEEQLKKIVSWIQVGAREGDPADYIPPLLPAGFQADLTVPLLADGSAFLPDQSLSDEYRCFIIPFDGRFGSNAYITGFNAHAGNKRIAHHLVAYMASAAVLPVLQELDAAEAGAGYRCFGGALPDRIGEPAVQTALEAKYPGIIDHLNNETYWLAHWAPGMDAGYRFPADTGIKVPANGAFVIQMHYYTADAKGEADQNTSFAMELAVDVKKPAFYYPLTNNSWLNGRGNQSMVIPAGEIATFSTEASLTTIAGYGAFVLGVNPASIKNIEAHSANLHMHAIGASGAITLGGETLLSVPEWDLHWQRDFQLEKAKIFAPAQWSKTVNRVTCTYHNDRETAAYGGFGSLDEMCFNFGFFAFDLGL